MSVLSFTIEKTAVVVQKNYLRYRWIDRILLPELPEQQVCLSCFGKPRFDLTITQVRSLVLIKLKPHGQVHF